MDPSRKTNALLLNLVLSIIVLAALRWSASVAVPLVFALFLIAVTWPVYFRLERKMPRGLAALITLTGLLAVLGLLVLSAVLAGKQIVQNASLGDYQTHLSELRRQFFPWIKEEQLHSFLESSTLRKELPKLLAEMFQAFLTGTVLALALFTLGLLEVRQYGQRVRRFFPRVHPRFVQVMKQTAQNFQYYLLVRTGIGLLTGAAVTAVCFPLGLDFPVLWGLMNFLLNYVPTLGSIIGVLPAPLYALAQTGDPQLALWALLAIGGVQLLMGNYVDPLIQGKYMRLSPFVVLLSVAFWGIIWGISGALLAVPLTVLLVLVGREFRSTQFLAALLAAPEDDSKDGSTSRT